MRKRGMRQLLLLLVIGLLCMPLALAKGETVCTDRDGDLFKVEGGTCGLVDCNDNNIFANPGRDERCQDQVDNNCDGIINEDCPECSDMRDNDDDGLVDLEDEDCDSIDDSDEGPPPPPPPPECTADDGDGFAFEGGECGQEDCDDGDPEVNPIAQEVCDNGKDDNCNDLEDELDICSEASPVLCEDSGG